MLPSSVLEPGALNRACFEALDYRLHIETYLDGLMSNGLLVFDSRKKLLDLIWKELSELPTKFRQRIQIKLEEAIKALGSMKRLVVSREGKGSDEGASLAYMVHSQAGTDWMVAGHSSIEVFKKKRSFKPSIVPMAGYYESDLERGRKFFMENYPPIDQLEGGEPREVFKKDLEQLLRFAKWIRIYDKQIGKSGDIASFDRFRNGIEFILGAWQNGYFASDSECKVEIITGPYENKINTSTQDFRTDQLKKYLVLPLREKFSWPIHLLVKRVDSDEFHARHLQTQSAVVLFERGFDFLNKKGGLKRSIVKIDNPSKQHLDELYDLPGY